MSLRVRMPSRFETRNRVYKIRRYFMAQMPLPCWRCGTLLTVDDEWDLGHRIDLAHGGSDHDVWPEHRYAVPGICIGNRNGGAQVRARGIGGSREW